MANQIGPPRSYQSGPTPGPIAPVPGGYSFDPMQGGNVPTIGSASDQVAQRTRAQGIQDIGNQQEQGLYARLSSAVGGLGSGSGSFGGVNTTGTGMGTGMIPPPATAGMASSNPGQLAASNAAAFATAKDNAAKTGQAAMTGLNDELTRRGLTGGGYEAGQIGQNLSREANTIGSTINAHAQAMYGQGQQRDLADLNANVAQRGQDLGAGVAQRWQTIQAGEANNSLQFNIGLAKQNALLAALGGLSRATPGLSY